MVLLAIHQFVQANGSESGSDAEEALLHHVGRALQAQGGMVVVRRGLGARDMAKSASTLKNTFLVVRPAPGAHTNRSNKPPSMVCLEHEAWRASWSTCSISFAG